MIKLLIFGASAAFYSKLFFTSKEMIHKSFLRTFSKRDICFRVEVAFHCLHVKTKKVHRKGEWSAKQIKLKSF